MCFLFEVQCIFTSSGLYHTCAHTPTLPRSLGSVCRAAGYYSCIVWGRLLPKPASDRIGEQFANLGGGPRRGVGKWGKEGKAANTGCDVGLFPLWATEPPSCGALLETVLQSSPLSARSCCSCVTAEGLPAEVLNPRCLLLRSPQSEPRFLK